MRTLLLATPLRNLTWGAVALVAGIALMSGFVNVLHGAVQRGEWKASRTQAGAWTTAELNSNDQATSPAEAELSPPEDVAAVLQLVSR